MRQKRKRCTERRTLTNYLGRMLIILKTLKQTGKFLIITVIFKRYMIYFSLIECGIACNIKENCNVLRYLNGICHLGTKEFAKINRFIHLGKISKIVWNFPYLGDPGNCQAQSRSPKSQSQDQKDLG